MKLIVLFRNVVNTTLVSGMLMFGSAAFAAGDMEELPPVERDMPTVVPGSEETPDSVFSKLDQGKKGYLLPEDVQVLPGFEPLFVAADDDKDGRLNMKEFKKAWPAYTGS